MSEEYIFEAAVAEPRANLLPKPEAFEQKLRSRITRNLDSDQDTPLHIKGLRVARVVLIFVYLPKVECVEMKVFNSCITGYCKDMKDILSKIDAEGFLTLGTNCAEKMRKMLAKIKLAMAAVAAIADESTKPAAVNIEQDAQRKIDQLFEAAKEAGTRQATD